jgi:type IV pilus assembly protein PilQ
MKHIVLKCFWIWLLLGPKNVFAYQPTSDNTAPNTPISISAKEMPLVDLLHALGQLGNTHFVLSPSIQGSINIQLVDVPWQTALSTILASRGLRFIRNQGIYWIAPHQEINAFQKQRRDDSALPFGGEHHGTPRQILMRPELLKLTIALHAIWVPNLACAHNPRMRRGETVRLKVRLH